jgi:hypothetical protein
MIRHVNATALAACPISIAAAYVQEFLGGSEIGSPGTMVIAGPLRRRVRLQFGTASDETEIGRRNEEVAIRWSARTRWLPDFAGTLRFRIASVHTTTLLLSGTYVPPGGALGLIFDRIAGARIAQATIDRFADRIARAIEAHEAAWQQQLGDAPATAP